MAYLGKFSEEPKKELQAILRSNDLQKAAIAGANTQAMEECRDFIALSTKPIIQLFSSTCWKDMASVLWMAR